MGQQDDTQPKNERFDAEGALDRAPADQETQPETGEGAGAGELALRIEEAEGKAREYWDQLLRARADLENERRRFRRELENAHKFGLERFVQSLLPVKDSLELGLAAANESADVEKLREGMDLTLKMLQSTLDKFGVGEINPIGERFNPEQHESMSSQESASVEPNTVMTVYQKGYSLNDRLLRPALVVISKAPADGDDGRA
jgi:molecular chaperone GrpE